MTQFDTAAPYIACFIILRRDNQVAFVLRGEATGWMAGHYALPAGKVEKDEAYSTAATREAKEEVGVKIEATNLHHKLTMHRHGDDIDWVDVYFEASKWEGEPSNAEPHMHDEFVWLDLGALPENVVPPQRVALEAIARGETYAEYGW